MVNQLCWLKLKLPVLQLGLQPYVRTWSEEQKMAELMLKVKVRALHELLQPKHLRLS